MPKSNKKIQPTPNVLLMPDLHWLYPQRPASSGLRRCQQGSQLKGKSRPAAYVGLLLPQDHMLHPGYFTVACQLLSDARAEEEQPLYPPRQNLDYCFQPKCPNRHHLPAGPDLCCEIAPKPISDVYNCSSFSRSPRVICGVCTLQ